MGAFRFSAVFQVRSVGTCYDASDSENSPAPLERFTKRSRQVAAALSPQAAPTK